MTVENTMTESKISAERLKHLLDNPEHINPRYELSAIITLALEALALRTPSDVEFKLGDRVTKTKGASWTGRVVGFYSTTLTPAGYAVESENEPGSVQIYPGSALAAIPATGGEKE